MKKVMMMVVAVVAAISAKADLLYFMADSFSWEGDKYFDFALVGVANNGEIDWGEGDSKVYLNIQSTPDSQAGTSIFAAANDSRTQAFGWADVSDYTADNYTFYIETYTNDGQGPIWGYGEETAKSYAQLVRENHIYKPGSTDPANLTAWVVPEPSSAMLLLLGVAGLALKRRKVVKG